MKKKFLLFILLIVFVVSSLSFFIILNFVDPYSNWFVWITSLIISFLLSVWTFLSIFLYLIKKAYYRGDVFLYHVYSSFRQGFFVSIFLATSIIFYHFSIFNFINIAVLLALFVFLELFIRNLTEPK